MLNTILFWILRLAPLEPSAQTHAVADAIAAVVEDRREAAILSTISFAETRFGHEGAAFGACAHLCHHHCGECHTAPLEDVARWSLIVLKTGQRLCGPQLSVVLGFYHSGRCVPDAFSRMEARIAKPTHGRSGTARLGSSRAARHARCDAARRVGGQTRDGTTSGSWWRNVPERPAEQFRSTLRRIVWGCNPGHSAVFLCQRRTRVKNSGLTPRRSIAQSATIPRTPLLGARAGRIVPSGCDDESKAAAPSCSCGAAERASPWLCSLDSSFVSQHFDRLLRSPNRRRRHHGPVRTAAGTTPERTCAAGRGSTS